MRPAPAPPWSASLKFPLVRGGAKRRGVFPALKNISALSRFHFLLLSTAAFAFAHAAPPLLLLAGAHSGTDLIVVGERATILRSGDQAASWETIRPPDGISATLTAVTFAPGTSTGWAAGHDALILSTTDAGRTWKKSWQGENLTESFLDVLALDARHVFAVGAYGLCLETTDAGQTWTRRKIIGDDRHLNRLTRGPGGTLYLAGERGTLLRSRDAGSTWTALRSPYAGSFYGVLPLDEHTLLAHGLRGKLYRSTDDGETWTQIPFGPAGLIATALLLRNHTVVFAGQARTFGLSRDLGLTTAPWPVPVASAVSSVVELPDGRILVLGEAGATVLPPP